MTEEMLDAYACSLFLTTSNRCGWNKTENDWGVLEEGTKALYKQVIRDSFVSMFEENVNVPC